MEENRGNKVTVWRLGLISEKERRLSKTSLFYFLCISFLELIF